METIVVTLWPMLHKRAEMASEAENAKQMSAYKHLLFPSLVHYLFSIFASRARSPYSRNCVVKGRCAVLG